MKTYIVERITPIPEFSGYYVSPSGNIYSTLAKGCRNKYDLNKRVLLKKIKPRYTKNGYCRVCMRRDNSIKREDQYIHRIVGQVYLENPNNYSEINNKDCNPSNNHKDNLEWVSHKENLQYAIEFGNMKRNKKGQFEHK